MEFVVMMAMLSAMVAFAIDAMLPALPDIGAVLSPEAPNRVQLILTSFVAGMGIGTFVSGPLSDRFGRKRTVILGSGIYIIGAVLAALSGSLELMLAARFVQGIGAAFPRVISIAIIRDLYSGREMARLLSFVMMVFSIFPAFAPTLGHWIIELTHWRGIFVAFVLFAVTCMLWLGLRLGETLPREERQHLSARALRSALIEVLSHPTTRLSILIQTLTFGMLFTTLSVAQPLFDITYGFGETFHLWFGAIALVSSSASLLNAYLVTRVGMRAIIRGVFLTQMAFSAGMAAVVLLPLPFAAEMTFFVIWVTSQFMQAGLTLGNLNALGLEPMGHIAGFAASIITAVSTVGSVIIAVPIGLSFDGTPLPIAIGIGFCALLAYLLTLLLRRDADAA